MHLSGCGAAMIQMRYHQSPVPFLRPTMKRFQGMWFGRQAGLEGDSWDPPEDKQSEQSCKCCTHTFVDEDWAICSKDEFPAPG